MDTSAFWPADTSDILKACLESVSSSGLRITLKVLGIVLYKSIIIFMYTSVSIRSECRERGGGSLWQRRAFFRWRPDVNPTTAGCAIVSLKFEVLQSWAVQPLSSYMGTCSLFFGALLCFERHSWHVFRFLLKKKKTKTWGVWVSPGGLPMSAVIYVAHSRWFLPPLQAHCGLWSYYARKCLQLP